jgi:hypothetical protein
MITIHVFIVYHFHYTNTNQLTHKLFQAFQENNFFFYRDTQQVYLNVAIWMSKMDALNDSNFDKAFCYKELNMRMK